MAQIYHEITPLTQHDCFTFFYRHKKEFDFPLHTHDEFELNLIIGGKGIKRIVGDNTERIGACELVLIGSNLPHGWFHAENEPKSEDEILEITIQFHKDLFDDKFLKRNQLYPIRTLLEKSSRGILFSEETSEAISKKIIELTKKSGFDSVLEFFSILFDLATARNIKILSNTSFSEDKLNHNSRRLQKVFEYMHENFSKEIKLEDVAELVGMTEVGFSRFMKARTGKTFIDTLVEIRLGQTSRMLIDTTHSVAEIAFKCGFNNISYFNRVFKSKNGCTPKEFRENYTGKRTFV